MKISWINGLKTRNKPLSALESAMQEVRYRDRIIIGLITISVLLGAALVRIPTQISVYHPPDLSKDGQITRLGEIPPSTVYAFATIFLERLMYCKDDCGVDFPRTLISLKAYLTPACFTELEERYQSNTQLFKNRTRSISSQDDVGFNFAKVQRIDHRTWHVTDNFFVDERVRGTAIRDTLMRYPLRIVKSNITTQINPYQMQLDCFYEEPVRLDIDDVKKDKEIK